MAGRYHVRVFRDFGLGVLDGVRGAVYLARHRALWKWVVAPAVVVAIVGAITIGWIGAIARAFGLVGWTSLAIASATLIVTVGALIAGPFNELLSEAIEERETGAKPPPFSAGRFVYELSIGILHAARRGAVYILFLLLLLVVSHIVPLIGRPLATFGSAWASARLASYASYDALWARRHARYREKITFLRIQRWRTIGLGAFVAVMLLVPGLNVIGLAIGSAGATLRMIAPPAPPTARC